MKYSFINTSEKKTLTKLIWYETILKINAQNMYIFLSQETHIEFEVCGS